MFADAMHITPSFESVHSVTHSSSLSPITSNGGICGEQAKMAKGAEVQNAIASVTPNTPNAIRRQSLRNTDDFEFINVLGKGALGKVYHGRNVKTNKEVAIKIVKKSRIVNNIIRARVFAERTILKELNHPNIVKLICTFQDEMALYFVLQFAGWYNLNEHLSRYGGIFSFDLARFYTAEIVGIIQYLRKHSVAHRDLKPENLLVDEEGHLKLIDFNSAIFTSTPSARKCSSKSYSDASSSDNSLQLVGTALYAAPELLDSEGDVGHAVDLWALGCITYQLLTGSSPFFDPSLEKLYKRICTLDYSFPQHLPAVVEDFIRRLLVVNPESRLGAVDISELSNHAFLKDLEISNIYAYTPPSVLAPTVQYTEQSTDDIEFIYGTTCILTAKNELIETLRSNELDTLELTPNIGESFLR